MALSVLPAGRAPRLAPVDLLVLLYLGAATAAAALRLSGSPALPWVLLANLLTAALVLLVRLAPATGLAGLVAEAYPLVLTIPIYGTIGLINGSGPAPTHDQLVQGWEQALFGGQPSRDWWQAAPDPFWSTVLHGAYWGYYLILLVPALVFALQGRRRELGRLALVVMAAFVPCYLTFLAFPVAGPNYAFPRPTGAFVDNAMARLVYGTLDAGSSYGTAFPSSHVAAAVAAVGGAWWGSPRLGRMLLVPALLLVVSVVYCQMHYALDALAGLAVGLAAVAAVGPGTTEPPGLPGGSAPA